MLALLIALAIATLIAGVFWIAWKRSPESTSAAERSLRNHCMGDRVQVQRLIDREHKRSPGLSRSKAAQAALAALRRDR